MPAIAERFPYREVALPQLELEPGLAETLGWLKGRGVRLAVHTNRGNGMWDLLDRFGLRAAFDPVMTAETVAPKPSPEGCAGYWSTGTFPRRPWASSVTAPPTPPPRGEERSRFWHTAIPVWRLPYI
ncbi:MAG: HAD hydrolase-like protein [Bilophila sp.]